MDIPSDENEGEMGLCARANEFHFECLYQFAIIKFRLQFFFIEINAFNIVLKIYY